MKTKSEIFETVAKHLLRQNSKAESREGCLYRAPNGKKCAVGCLILDKFYDPMIEHIALYQSSPLLNEILIDSGIPEDEDIHEMLCGLQSVHNDHYPNEWPTALARFHSKHFAVSNQTSFSYILSLQQEGNL